ncbi:hypothetical protein Lal_00028673 [Lupinus albus]|nr:hypothetical protein Lal_00028673 [Lupinus albus]
MGVSSISLRISGRKDSVDKNKSTNDLSTQSSTFVLAPPPYLSKYDFWNPLASPAPQIAPALCAAMYKNALISDILRPTNSPNVTAGVTRNSSSAVNKDEDHATKGPSNTQNTNSITFSTTLVGISLAIIPNNGQDGNVKEE